LHQKRETELFKEVSATPAASRNKKRAVEKPSVQKCGSEDRTRQHTDEEQEQEEQEQEQEQEENTTEFQKTRGARCR
jgi:hypothetical protein